MYNQIQFHSLKVHLTIQTQNLSFNLKSLYYPTTYKYVSNELENLWFHMSILSIEIFKYVLWNFENAELDIGFC